MKSRIKSILLLLAISSLSYYASAQREKMKVMPDSSSISIYGNKIYIPEKLICPKFECLDYKSQIFVPVVNFIDDIIGLRTESGLPNVFPGPPIASKKLLDSFGIKCPTSGGPAHDIYFYPETGLGSTTFYSLPRRLEYRYIPIKIAISKRDTIKRIIQSFNDLGFYQKFERHVEKPVPFFIDTDQIASYVQSYDLSDTGTFNGIYQISDFKDEQPKTLWVECYIPVDSNWIPVGNPSRLVRPIALETKAGFYIYAQTIVASFANGGAMDSYEGKIFDLSKAENLGKTYEKVLITFHEELSKQFTANPILSTTKPCIAPNQIRFQRLYEKSEVLKGFAGPYYELSTYTITLWQGPNGGFLGSGFEYQYHDYLKDSKINNQIYLLVTHNLQVSVGKIGKKYIEPEGYQYVAYQKAISKATLKAIENTTLRLNGQLINNIGIIK